MTRQVTGYFPDRETADHALAMLESAGLQVARTNVEDFGDPAYYEGQLPQGATAITVENPADRVAEVRCTMMHGGDLQLVGHGVEGRPTGMTALIDAEAPTPV
ncbi:MAG: hypothetical protein JWO59_1698, partial [Chloroflexi bacterium]|nr:hypothetical protein [Chloroflexota bacterium]